MSAPNLDPVTTEAEALAQIRLTRRALYSVRLVALLALLAGAFLALLWRTWSAGLAGCSIIAATVVLYLIEREQLYAELRALQARRVELRERSRPSYTVQK